MINEIIGAVIVKVLEKLRIFRKESRNYSSTQYIRLWPSNLGGINHLNIDNTGILTYQKTDHGGQITLVLNPVANNKIEHIKPGTSNKLRLDDSEIVFNPSLSTNFDIRDGSVTPENQTTSFSFNSGSNQRVAVDNRTFNVRLVGITECDVESVSSAIEYEFYISEKD